MLSEHGALRTARGVDSSKESELEEGTQRDWKVCPGSSTQERPYHKDVFIILRELPQTPEVGPSLSLWSEVLG